MELPARHKAILAYSVKLTVTPGAMVQTDLDEMRKQGLGDRDILDVNQVVGYFAYVNRLADGLGVVTDGYAETFYTSLMSTQPTLNPPDDGATL